MKIWLLNAYGPIPGEGWMDYRYSILGEALAKRGHEVIWWTANFSHHFKYSRSASWSDIVISPNFTIRLVPTIGYRKNISFRRLGFELLYTYNMYKRCIESPKPDCIFAVAPNSTCNPIAVKLANKYNIPLFLDYFDLYPEIFAIALPRSIRFLAPIILSPLYWLRKRDAQYAKAITAVCDAYLDVARSIVPGFDNQRFRTAFIGIDVHSFRAKIPNPDELQDVRAKYGKGVKDIWTIYAGSIGNNYDIETLLRSSLILSERKSPVKIVIAGDGPQKCLIEDFIREHSPTNLIFFGKVEFDELIKLYAISDVALSIYVPGSTVSMPTKIYDYFAAGLPVVNSLSGELESLLRENGLGVQYTAGNHTSLADSIENIASNEVLRKSMARKSYDVAMRFDQRLQYENLSCFIEQNCQSNI